MAPAFARSGSVARATSTSSALVAPRQHARMSAFAPRAVGVRAEATRLSVALSREQRRPGGAAVVRTSCVGRGAEAGSWLASSPSAAPWLIASARSRPLGSGFVRLAVVTRAWSGKNEGVRARGVEDAPEAGVGVGVRGRLGGFETLDSREEWVGEYDELSVEFSVSESYEVGAGEGIENVGAFGASAGVVGGSGSAGVAPVAEAGGVGSPFLGSESSLSSRSALAGSSSSSSSSAPSSPPAPLSPSVGSTAASSEPVPPPLAEDPSVMWASVVEEALGGSDVYLVGMMGSGKSTIGKVLAKALGYSFVDLDAEIETMTGRSIPELFRDEGEDIFRSLETEALRAVPSSGRYVVATGGGAVLRDDNWLIMNRGLVIWIDVPVHELARRVVAQGVKSRPLVAGGTAAATAATAETAAEAAGATAQPPADRQEGDEAVTEGVAGLNSQAAAAPGKRPRGRPRKAAARTALPQPSDEAELLAEAEARLAAILETRQSRYERAHVVADGSGGTPEEVVGALLEAVATEVSGLSSRDGASASGSWGGDLWAPLEEDDQEWARDTAQSVAEE